MHKRSPILYFNTPALWWHQPKPRNKKRKRLQEKLSENIGKPKELWKII